MHARMVIRQTVQSALLGRTAAGSRVYKSRVVPYRRSDLPTISVYTPEEAVDDDSATTSPRDLTRRIPLAIEGWVAPGDNVDDAMDNLAEQIEDVMHADPFLAGVVDDSILSDTTMEVIEVGDHEMGLLIMIYGVTYHTLAPVSPVLTDEFLLAGSTWNIDGQLSEDLIQVRPPVPEGPIASFGAIMSRQLANRTDVRVYLDRLGFYILP